MRFLNGNSFFRGFLPAFVYFFFIVLIGYFAARQGRSHHHAEQALSLGSNAEAAAAIGYQQENPEAHRIQGELALQKEDYSAAAAAFERAISRRRNDFGLWLRLGYSRLKLGDPGAAEMSYRQALDLAPNYSEPNYDLGTLLLETGRKEEAFRHLSKAADRDPELYPEVLRRARIAFPDDPQAIENALNPTSREAKKQVARYLIEHNLVTDGVRSFLASGELADAEKNDFIQYLLQKQNFAAAREVWLSKQHTSAASPLNEPIFDGGFEAITESDPSGLGWQINQRISATAVARDRSVFHSGSSSLRVKFAGEVELGKDIVSQLAFVEPDHKYTLSLFTRSPELVSAGMPAITVIDGVTGEILARSTDFETTGDKWVERKVEFITKKSSVVRISFQRPACNTSPCPIFGDLYLDDFRLFR